MSPRAGPVRRVPARHLHWRLYRLRARLARRGSVLALLAVVGPGVLAGLSDDDPAGITTYSILEAKYGYELLWVLTLSTAALIIFHELAARMGSTMSAPSLNARSVGMARRSLASGGMSAGPSARIRSRNSSSVIRVSRVLTRPGTLRLSVRTPDGAAISDRQVTLVARGQWRNGWHRLGDTAATRGRAAIRLRLPRTLRGKKIKLRVEATGPGYVAAAVVRTVRVK